MDDNPDNSVYHDTHMSMDSFIASTPAKASPMPGKPPLNAQYTGSSIQSLDFASLSIGEIKVNDNAQHATSTVENLDFSNLSLDDIKFDVGFSPRNPAAPRNRKSPKKKKKNRTPKKSPAKPATSPVSVGDMFSPMVDSPDTIVDNQADDHSKNDYSSVIAQPGDLLKKNASQVNIEPSMFSPVAETVPLEVMFAESVPRGRRQNMTSEEPIENNIKFQVDLSGKSLKDKFNKMKAKRGSRAKNTGPDKKHENVLNSSPSISNNINLQDEGSPPQPMDCKHSPTPPSMDEIQFNVGVGDKLKTRQRQKKKETLQNPLSSVPNPQKESAEGPVQFNVGVGGKSLKNKSKPKRTDRSGRSQSAYFVTETSNRPFVSGTGPPSEQQKFYERSFSANEMNFAAASATKQMKVIAWREEGKAHYIAGDYKSSITKYSMAIKEYKTNCMDAANHELLAVLYSNRAAGLLMVSAFQAAAEDCQQALAFLPVDMRNLLSSSEVGPAFQAKVYTRMARAFLKLGQSDNAQRSFQGAIDAANRALDFGKLSDDNVQREVAKKALEQVLTEATLGGGEVRKLKEALAKIAESTKRPTYFLPQSSDRERDLEALSHVGVALSIAFGCDALHEQKVLLLANLKRWREVASHCERLAAQKTDIDGCFTEDLAPKYPFHGIPAALSLSSKLFGDSKEDEFRGASIKLNSKASAEAVLRIPRQMTPHYLRALRLQERYPAAEACLNILSKLIRECVTLQDQTRLQSEYNWLPTEQDKLIRTKRERDKADELFRNGHFDQANCKYATCLKIDSEGTFNTDASSNAGGRLHAVLHCNRAACLMALKRFHEAATECTAALRIHPRYMKALLRRARCYEKLDRHEEAIAEYNRWLEMVNQAKSDPASVSPLLSPCLFDGPNETKDTEISQVMQELNQAKKVKAAAEATARAEQAYRQQKEKWQNDTFNSTRSDAQSRRDYFYSQSTGSRRWDSFTDRGPKRSSKTNSKKKSADYKESTSKQKSSQEQEKGPASFSSDDNHYSVLQVDRNATEAEIKKAYRKMALKYHPDKNSDAAAVDMFRMAKQAYEVLKDPTARRQYDSELRVGRW